MPGPPSQLWIGMVEVRPMDGENELLGGMKGAFVNVVTWATDAEQFRRKAEIVIGGLGGLFVSEVVDPEPVQTRRSRSGGGFEHEMEDLITRARANPNAIIYGSFHTFEKDDA